MQVRIHDLEFRYPTGPFALRIDKLEFTAGSKIAIVGPSGSGKSTFLRLLAGIDSPQSGQIALDDIQMTAMDDKARRALRLHKIGYVFQDFQLLPHLSVLDNMELTSRLQGDLARGLDMKERSLDLASRLDIQHYLHRFPQQLSQGEQQRVAIARAVATKPTLILADEPTGNLDPTNKASIVKLLLRECELSEATLIVVTHDREILHHFDQTLDFSTMTQA